MTLDELIARCKCGVYLMVNQHRDYYQSAADYVAEHLKNHEDCPPDVVGELPFDGDTVVELQFYPNTPIGSYLCLARSLEDALKYAEECLTSDDVGEEP